MFASASLMNELRYDGIAPSHDSLSNSLRLHSVSQIDETYSHTCSTLFVSPPTLVISALSMSLISVARAWSSFGRSAIMDAIVL